MKPLVLVGKGITFDTGGISLKPAGEMDEMKFDMSGAGSVLGAIRALAGMKAPVNVVGVIPTCENMPGGQATRPGDIVTTLSGQTVEILNTDAEGRLILCDALDLRRRASSPTWWSTSPRSPAPASSRSGTSPPGLFANDQKLADEIRAAGDDACDRVWQMPLWEDYQEQLRSNFADFANIGGRPGGSDHRRVVPRPLHAQAALGAPRHRRHRLEERPREGLDRPAGAAAGALRAAPRRQEMTSIDFYFNAEDRLQVACRLAGKAVSAE